MGLQIKKILVPLDGSSNSFRGLDVAIHMARESHATITGLYVAGIVKPRTYPRAKRRIIKNSFNQ